jgi:hypothetical protein
MVRGVQVTGDTAEEVIMVRGGMEGIADSFGSQENIFFTLQKKAQKRVKRILNSF